MAFEDEPEHVAGELEDAERALREGRFQRWLALIAGLSSTLSGLDVALEHYRGSYSRRVMYTPVALSGALSFAAAAGFLNARAARTVLPAVCVITGADCAVGFYFHIRGIARKPGGWRLPIVNVVMGPPLFAPVLFGLSAYLGFVASRLRRDSGGGDARIPRAAHSRHWVARLGGGEDRIGPEQDLREAGFQRQLALATTIAAGLSGFEALYSHYKNNFRYASQWTPIAIAPLLMIAGLAARRRPRIAHTWLPAVSALAVLDGGAGFFFHVRGVLRRPGGRQKLFYNIVYGPPIFAPLLFAASGFLGLLASILRTEAP